MENYLVKGTEVYVTSDLEEICKTLFTAYQKIVQMDKSEDDTEDKLTHEPFIVSTDGSVIAKLNSESYSVGFYKTEGKYIKRLTHVKSEEDLEGSVFEFLRDKEVNLLTSQLPTGDIIIYTQDDSTTLDGESSVVEFIEGGAITLDEITKIVYTGISEGSPQGNVSLNFYSFLESYIYDYQLTLDEKEEVEEPVQDDEAPFGGQFLNIKFKDIKKDECTFPNCDCTSSCDNRKK